MRIVFLGTPDFAVPTLFEAADQAEVVLAVAQPDRPRGRGRALAAPPVKQAALALGVPCLQVEKPNRAGAVSALAALAPDLFVVVAYGAILSPALLAVPKLGAVNVHASLLPAYRGASPIQAAIADGRTETGVTTMWLNEGLDTGDVIYMERVAIGPEQTAGELTDVLARAGAALLGRTLRAIEAGTAPRTPQDGTRATVTKRLRKSDGFLDFAQPAQRVHDRARAMTPWPGALAEFDGETVRFTRTRVADEATVSESWMRARGRLRAVAEPGTVLCPSPAGGLFVACGAGTIEVLRVVPAGRSEMNAVSWWNGLRPKDDAPARFATPRQEVA